MSALLSDVSIKLIVLHMIGLSKVIERLTDMTFGRMVIAVSVSYKQMFNKRSNKRLILTRLSWMVNFKSHCTDISCLQMYIDWYHIANVNN